MGQELKGKKSRLAIFDTFKTKKEQLTGEALRQRAIIIALAEQTNPAQKTRTALSQRIAADNGTEWKNIYSGIFRDLDEILIPLGLVEEEGRLPLQRGPKALQEKGIPHYGLTQKGLLVASSLNEIKNRKNILKRFFSVSTQKEKEFQEIILKLAEITPRFTYSIFEKYVRAYCNERLSHLVPFSFSNLRQLSDETLAIQNEFLEGFLKLSKPEKEKTINFLKNVSEK